MEEVSKIQMNKYQTPITEELLEQLPEEVQDQLLDAITNIPFIQNLISPKREYAKDRPRDEDGRIIIDLANPHILENMDYFRPSALYFLEHGVFTHLRPNANPNSPYGKWLRQERDRCWKGYVRESDGEWVTGYLYWFLNYSPMMVTMLREVRDKKGRLKKTKKADRVESMPECWEGIYWRFHYLDQASEGGMYNDFEGGQNGAELASRGKGKAHPYSQKVYTPSGWKTWKEIKIGDYLYSKDGTPTKVISIPYDKVSDIYEVTLEDGRKIRCTGGHLFEVLNGRKKEIKALDTILKDYKFKNPFSIKSFPVRKYKYKLPNSSPVTSSSYDFKIDPYTLGIIIGSINLEKSLEEKALYLSLLDKELKNFESLIPYNINKISNNLYTLDLSIDTLRDYFIPENSNIYIPKNYLKSSKKDKLNLLKGLMDSKGSVISGVPTYTTKYNKIKEDIVFLARSLGYNCYIREVENTIDKDSLNSKLYIIEIYTNDRIFNLKSKYKLVKKNRKNNGIYITNIEHVGKELAKCVSVDHYSGLYLIGDFVVTHNSYSLASILSHIFILGENEVAHNKVRGVVTAYQKEYLTKDGILNKFIDMINFCASKTQFPRKRLKNSLQEMTWVMGYKDVELDIDKGSLNTIIGVSSKDDQSKIRGKRAAKILIEEFGSFPRLIDLYNVLLPSVQEGDAVFGQIFMLGTAGDSESDFSGAQEIMYYPKGYNMYALPNVYDKNNQGKPNFVFFFPAYVNRKGCYNKDGVSDVVKALIQILLKRYNTKYNSSEPDTILRIIAEEPITPAEAIIKAGVNMFPVADLSERLLQLDSNPREYDDVYVGELTLNSSKEVVFNPKSVAPIRDFPHKDNKIEGAIEIYKMPEKDRNGKTFNNRYILGCLKEGELVNTDSGFKKVEDVTLKDKLVNIDGGYVDIHNLQKYKNVEPVYKVKLSSIIDTTTFSAEHPIYCCTPKRRYNSYSRVKRLGVPERYYEYNFDFKKVSELKSGDVVKSPILYTNETKLEKFNNPDIWYLFGIILGDGWANSNGHSISISFNRKEKYLVNRCKNIVENILGRSFTLAKKEDSVLEYTFCHKELNEYFSTYFGKGAKNKHIDFSLKTIPYECRKNLILGYIDSDGCIYRNTVNITSISKTLLSDIQDWLFSMRITSSIKLLREEGIHIIDGIECNTEVTYSLSIGTIGLNTIKDWGIDSMKVGNYTKVEALNHNKKDIVFDGDYMYIKVKSIDVEDYIGDVYNFECDTHTFMCNYIPTHNCDPYDDDVSNTMSLGSVFVLDLWTDKIVAEYTGRPVFAEDFYEICRKLCLFYNGRMNYENNKKGLFGYFSKMNSLYLLTDTLEFLKDKDMVKGASYGNKAHPYSEKVYTPHGIKKWGDINVGDWLYNTKGGITRVIDVPFDSITDIYEITLKDGRKVRASKNHLWNVIDWNGYSKILSTTQIKHNYYREKGKYKEYKYYIPSNMGVEYNSIKVKLPPYFMGIMLGDGCFTNSRHNQAYFTSTINDMSEYKNNIPFAYKTRDNRHHCWIVPNIGKILIEYGLQEAKSHTKFIPNEYKYNSKEVRLEVLQGLLDTDGHVGYGGNPEYVTVSNKLCDDVIEGARSLGINCNKQVSVNSYGKVYKVIFYTNIKLFKLTRKASRQRITKTRAYKTAIVNIEYIGKEKSKCVTVDSNDSCYLIGDFITTHNSKGTIASSPINAYARNRIRSWLLSPVPVIQNIDGEDKEVIVPNLYTLRNRALIKELVSFNTEGNFDRISALGMLMLLREDKLIMYGENGKLSKEGPKDSNYLGNDPFFDKNYKR